MSLGEFWSNMKSARRRTVSETVINEDRSFNALDDLDFEWSGANTSRSRNAYSNGHHSKRSGTNKGPL